MNKKRKMEILTGYNNDNYVMDINNEYIVFRIPNSGNNDSDIRLCQEGEILISLQDKLDMIPQVIYYDNDRHLLIEKFIEGKTLNSVYPVEDILPDEIIIKIARIMKKVHSCDCLQLPIRTCYKSNLTSDFYYSIKQNIEKTCKKYFQIGSKIYESLGICYNDLENFFLNKKKITERDLKLCHCDVHRKNMIIDGHKKIWLLDWELCLLGDTFYDLAIHFQKMRYSEEDIGVFLFEYFSGYNDGDINDFYHEIKIYQDMEAVKYAIIDLIHIIRSKKAGKDYKELLRRYKTKLINAYQALGKSADVFEDLIEDILEKYNEVSI